MKRLTIFAILVIHAAAMSAQTYNFFAEDHKIYWQKIYETDMDIDICSLLINEVKKPSPGGVGKPRQGGQRLPELCFAQSPNASLRR